MSAATRSSTWRPKPRRPSPATDAAEPASWTNGASKAAIVQFAESLGLAEVRGHAREGGRRTGALDVIGEDLVFHTIDEAVDALGPAD